MNFKSRNNLAGSSELTDDFQLFYRYCIEDGTDLSESTFQRREKKRLQSNRTAFFFEISTEFKDWSALFQFVELRIQEKDCLLFGIECFDLISEKWKYQTFWSLKSRNSLLLFSKLPKHSKLLLEPRTVSDLKDLTGHYSQLKANHQEIYWRFEPYNPNIKNSITIKDICKIKVPLTPLPGLQIQNIDIPKSYELEPEVDVSYSVEWTFQSKSPAPLISFIIPTYNTATFLINVIWHLIRQKASGDQYEIIVVDDGSSDGSSTIAHEVFNGFKEKYNITYIYWTKKHPHRGDQSFFRAGLARNLATTFSKADHLVFLDSDIIVPENFFSICLGQLKTFDLIQFQRYHIHQHVSSGNPSYKSIQIANDTYIEEKNYWSDLFFAPDWQALPNYWKYTCTYALGISKAHFKQLGQFKTYYISYGFEDTDLGYEAFKRNLKFKLVKIPLLHLTSYDRMQYKNSFSKRFRLLRVTAQLFFLQHLNSEIYYLLGNYFRAQKPLKAYLRDLF